MVSINHEIVKQLSKDTECPILEMFFTKDDGYWYVCFEEYIVINGEDQIVHLDEVMEAIEKYDNIEWLTNETYFDDEKGGETYFEQVSFQWRE